MSALSCLTPSSLRAQKATVAPCSASMRTAAAPIPTLAPVMTAVRPENDPGAKNELDIVPSCPLELASVAAEQRRHDAVGFLHLVRRHPLEVLARFPCGPLGVAPFDQPQDEVVIGETV